MHRIIKLPRRRKRKCTRASRVGLLYSPGAPLILFRKPLGALRVAIHGVARRTTYAEKSLSLCADRGARPAQRLQTNQKLLHARSDAPKATLSALLLPQLQGYSILLCSASTTHLSLLTGRRQLQGPGAEETGVRRPVRRAGRQAYE
jgi:hypothetical protein